MMLTLVIGYGNPLRGDDGVGWYMAEQLADGADPQEIQVLACHSLTPELSHPISRADLVIFIDAAHGDNPGAVSSVQVKVQPVGARAIVHEMGPGQLLGYAWDVFKRCPTAYLMTVVGEDFGYRETLTPAVRRSCDRLLVLVRELIEQHRHGVHKVADHA